MNDAPPPLPSSDASQSTGATSATSPQFVILGAHGDLTARLLLPGIGSLMSVRPGFSPRLVGVDRASDGDRGDDAAPGDADGDRGGGEPGDADGDAWASLVRDHLAVAGPERAEAAAAQAEFVACDLLDENDLRALTERLEPDCILYFALPPSVTERLVVLLGRIGLPDGARLALEKPIGSSEATARELNEAVQRLAPEERVFRVDHFLGKATVLNVLAVRFANAMFEPLWNRTYVDRVDIRYEEELTVEGRGHFYDATGALRDMIQSHLLLVAAIVCMDEPSSIDHVEFRDLVAHALRATHVYGRDPVASSRRARYVAGRIGDRDVPDYVDEPGVDPARATETLAEVTLEARTQRWAGVPITLRTGKALGDPRRVIRLHLRPVPLVPDGLTGEATPNVIELDLNNSDFSVTIATTAEGDAQTLEPMVLRGRPGRADLNAYGEVLEHLVDGDPLLSVRGDVAERCWAIVDPVLAAWRAGEVPMQTYAAGSDGPADWS